MNESELSSEPFPTIMSHSALNDVPNAANVLFVVFENAGNGVCILIWFANPRLQDEKRAADGIVVGVSADGPTGGCAFIITGKFVFRNYFSSPVNCRRANAWRLHASTRLLACRLCRHGSGTSVHMLQFPSFHRYLYV